MNADTTRRTDETATTTSGGPTARGQSEVIAVVLLLAVVILSLSVLVASGTSAIVETRDRAEIGAAEHALAAFDSDVSAVAFGQSRATTDLGLRANDGEVRYRDTGWIRVVVDNETSAETVVVNESMGTVEYRQGETTIASQGGGVWRSDGDGSVVLSRPEFHYRDRTLTLPIVSMDGETGLTSRLDSRPDGAPVQGYPNRTAGFSNPPDSGSVTVTVQSEYYDAWGRYFESETDAIVTYDHANERVTVTFVVLPGRTTFDAGIIATSSAGELVVAGTGAYVDSYNSSAGDYAQTESANGLIQSAGDFQAKGDSVVDGDVRSGGTVDLQGSTDINGSVYWTKAPEPDSSEKDKVAGEVKRIDGVRSVMPIDTFVETYAQDVRERNDNDETSAITDEELTTTGSSTELDAGSYYVHNITLDGESMALNTTDGEVTVVVRDYVKLKKGGNITVESDGIARIVVAGENDTVVSPTGLGSKPVNFHVGKNSSVHIPEEDSRHLRVYGTRDFNATIAGSNSDKASFDGLLYAPAGTDGSGYVYIKQGDLYGLAVTGNLTVGQYGAAHYDYGLSGQRRIRSPFSEIERLHVTVHRVRIESE